MASEKGEARIMIPHWLWGLLLILVAWGVRSEVTMTRLQTNQINIQNNLVTLTLNVDKLADKEHELEKDVSVLKGE